MDNTDADVQAMRHLLAAPAEREFPEGRMRQREEHFVTSMNIMSGKEKAKDRRPVVRARRWAVAGGGLAAAAGIAAVLLIPGSEPAYAVSTNNDGTVTITVNAIGDPAEANEALQETGVRAVVMLPQTETACPAENLTGVTPVGFHRDNFGTDLVPTDFLEVTETTQNGNEVRIRPERIPAGQIVILAPVPGPQRPLIQVSLAAQPGPNCITDFTKSWLAPTPTPTVSRTPAMTRTPGTTPTVPRTP